MSEIDVSGSGGAKGIGEGGGKNDLPPQNPLFRDARSSATRLADELAFNARMLGVKYQTESVELQRRANIASKSYFGAREDLRRKERESLNAEITACYVEIRKDSLTGDDRRRKEIQYGSIFSEAALERAYGGEKNSGGGGGTRGSYSRGAGRAASLGAVIGGLASGRPGAVLGELGGVIGAEIGRTFGPEGAVVGAIVGSLARYAINPAGAIAGSAGQAVDLKRFSYGMGRVGGVSGSRLYSSYGPESGVAQPWMAQLGVTAGETAASLAAIGSIPQGVDPRDLGQFLQTAGQSKAYYGLPQGQFESFGKSAWGTGGAAPTTAGLNDLLINKLAPVLEAANLKATDRSQVLSAIQSSTESLAKAGTTNTDPGGIANQILRTMGAGFTGAQAISATQSVVAGFQATNANVFANPLARNVLLTTPMDLSTPKGIAAATGGAKLPPNVIAQILAANNAFGHNAGVQAVAGYITEAQTYSDIQGYLKNQMGFSDEQVTGSMKNAIESYTNNPNSPLAMDWNAGKMNRTKLPTGSKTFDFMAGIKDPRVGRLMAAKFNPDAARLIVAASDKAHIPYDEYAATLASQFGGDPSKVNALQGQDHPGRINYNGQLLPPGLNPNGTTDWGMSNINSNSKYFTAAMKGNPNDPSVRVASTIAGALVLRDKLIAAHGDFGSAAETYTGTGKPGTQKGKWAADGRNFALNTLNRIRGVSQQDINTQLGLSNDANGLRATGAAGDLRDASIALQQLGPPAQMAAIWVNDLVKALKFLITPLPAYLPGPSRSPSKSTGMIGP